VHELEVSANGLTFRAVATGPGDGRPVLFLHGFPQTSYSWHHQLDAVGAAGYRGLAFDQRGYSPKARPGTVDDYRIGELVGDVLAVADAWDLGRFDLVGHDWGAMVAWVVAARHPERVRTLTAVSVPHPRAFAAAFGGGVSGDAVGGGPGEGSADGAADGAGDGAGDADQRQRSSYIAVFRAEGGVAERALLGEDGSGAGLKAMFDASGLSSDTEEVRRFVAAMLEPGALTAALNWYRATEPNSLTDVGAITVPTLYVWSDDDIALGRRAAEATVDWVTGPYRFEVLEGVSHWIPESAPADLNRMLLEHLAAHQ
jgi:pimeloyl-ACP methyl ester carboxylesterase